MRSNLSLLSFWQSVIWFILFLQARSQSTVTTWKPYQPLPTTPLAAVSGNGTFLWPVTISVQYFTIGSVMNISWTSDFARVNLFAIPNFEWNSPVGLITNTPATYFEWTVDCAGACSVPWLIRAVDAEANQEGQLDGGFVSAEFWIGSSDGSSTSSSLASNPASSKSSTTSSTSSTPSSTSISKSSSSSSSTTSQASSAASSSTSTSVASSYSTSTPALQSTSSSSASAPLSTNAAIGIGVGLGVGLAAMSFGWFLLWRHYRRSKKTAPTSDEQEYTDQTSKTLSAQVSTKDLGPSELAVPSPKYYEAQGRDQEPQELSAGTPVQYHSPSAWRG